MFGFSNRQPSDPPSKRPRCARCGSEVALHYADPGNYYCESCLGRFRHAPHVPFDVVVDEWTAALGALQTTGELIAVRLPRGFYGLCLLAGESASELTHLSTQRRPPTARTQPSTNDHIDTAHPGVPPKRSRRHPSGL